MSTSAAARAFAIPELLENILLNMPETHGRPEQYYGLLRVSQDFRNTIEGSSEIRRLMFLAPHKNTGHYESVAWLLEQLMRPDHISYRAREKDTKCRLVNITLGYTFGSDDSFANVKKRLGQFQNLRASNAEARWRKMRMGCSGRKKRLYVQFNISLGAPLLSPNMSVEWKFDSWEKLECLYNKWIELMSAMEKLKVKKVELQAKYHDERRNLENEGRKELSGLLR